MNPADLLPVVAPALLAGILVLLTHIPLGIQVLRRGIVFIDLTIAQIAGLGVIVAGLLGLEAQGWAVQAAAAAAALLGGCMLAWMERRWPDVQEAQIGAVFVLAASAGVLLLAQHPHGEESLRDLLVGQILWVDYARLVFPALLSGMLAIILWFKRHALPPSLFYAVFALAVTVSVQLVGVYLVFASLIIPALATRRLQGQKRLGAAFALGLFGYGLGLVLSTLWDLPSGALIVWCLALAGTIVFAASHKRQRVQA